jgi:hypothetical protein
MQAKSYSLQEKIEIFKKSACGAEEDYQRFYRGSFPEQDIVKKLTNDELISKHDWIDQHADYDTRIKYLSGYALHCRFEMGRRLREGIEKFEIIGDEANESLLDSDKFSIADIYWPQFQVSSNYA